MNSPTDKDTGETMIEKMWSLFEMAVIAGIIVIVSLGIRSCTIHDWQQEIACRKAGGTLMHISGAEGCYRITAEPIQP